MTMRPEDKIAEIQAEHKKVNANVQAVIKDIKETKVTDDYTKKDIQEIVDKLNTYLFMYNTAYSSKLVSLTEEIEDNARKNSICADPIMMARINKAVGLAYTQKVSPNGCLFSFYSAYLSSIINNDFSDVIGDDRRVILSIIEELVDKSVKDKKWLARVPLKELFIAVATYSDGTVLESGTAYATYDEAKRKLADMADVGDGPVEFVNGRVAKIYTAKAEGEN